MKPARCTREGHAGGSPAATPPPPRCTAAPALTREAQDWLDRVDQLGGCWASVADLLAGGEPDTAKLADLLGFLSREYTAAREGLHAALLADIATRP